MMITIHRPDVLHFMTTVPPYKRYKGRKVISVENTLIINESGEIYVRKSFVPRMNNL